MAEVDKDKHSSPPVDHEVLEPEAAATTTDPEKGSDHKSLEKRIVR